MLGETNGTTQITSIKIDSWKNKYHEFLLIGTAYDRVMISSIISIYNAIDTIGADNHQAYYANNDSDNNFFVYLYFTSEDEITINVSKDNRIAKLYAR